MPPKSVTCSICNQTVLKSQTLALKDGTRACRAHPGVKEEAELLKEKARLEREHKEKRKQHRFRPQPMPNQNELLAWREHTETHCWVCGREGVSLQEFYLQSLVAMKRLQIRGEFDFLNLHNDIAKLLPGLIVLAPIQYDETTDEFMRPLIKDRKVRDLLPFLRFMRLCGDCIKKHGFQERFEESLPQPSFEQVKKLMPVMGMVDPVLREIAERKEGQS